MKSFKTPLRYPGGKSKVINRIKPYFPNLKNYKEYREPFLGGGSVAIYVTKNYPHLKVWVNDLYEPLSNFWQQLQIFGKDIEDQLLNLKLLNDNPKLARELFKVSKEKINDKSFSNIDRAVAFYIVNKCSFSGLTESSSFSEQASNKNFTIKGIEKLSTYSKLINNWCITNYSYEDLINEDSGVFIYLDPPYIIKDNIYGKKGILHKEFNHNQFILKCISNNTSKLISYNSNNEIKVSFKKWNIIEYDLNYSILSTKKYRKEQMDRKELLIFNYKETNNE
jgi:DNA adenine methylase